MPNPSSRFDTRRPRAAGPAPFAQAAARASIVALAAGLTLAGIAPATRAGTRPVAARSGLEIATVAAHSWSPDAALIYLENDEDVDGGGAAERWGYLYFSPSLDKARAYSVRDGRIQEAENLEMKFEAPPVTADWIDSPAAMRAAAREAERTFKRIPGVRLTTMLLMRGAFDDTTPDRTTWTLVYTAPNQPSLFVVVDAAAGKVRKTWRG